MQKTVIGVFKSREMAETAIKEMRKRGFAENEISIVAKNEKGKMAGRSDTEFGKENYNDSIVDGTTTGGVLGGLAGLVIGAGALAIPGIGPIIAAGPIAGALSGAATGGVVGGLVDYGIPSERSKHYENRVKEGNILAVIHVDDDRQSKAADILRNNGAMDVEAH